jgi:hypothetical protein
MARICLPLFLTENLSFSPSANILSHLRISSQMTNMKTGKGWCSKIAVAVRRFVSGLFEVRCQLPPAPQDTIANVVVRRFGAREIAPQGQEVESASTS